MDKYEARREMKQKLSEHLNKMPHFKYGKDTLFIEQQKYATGSLALRILDESGSVWGMLSTNIPAESEMLGAGEFFAKTWSENEDWSKAALASGLFVDTGDRMPTGFVFAPIWRINF